MKIAFLTRSLKKGGAERQLTALAKGLSDRNHEVHVVCFYPGGEFEKELCGTGVILHRLNKAGRWDNLGFLFRLYRLLRRVEPEVLHGYLAVPNIVGMLMRFLGINTKVVFGVRASDMDLSRYDWSAKWVYRIECSIAKYADLIIANSHAGKRYAVGNGFPENKLVVVSNGIETDKFTPDPMGRKQMRLSWQAPDDTVVVGMVARLDPMKGYELFLQAAAIFAANRKVLFVCVGHGKADYAETLTNMCAALGLADKVKWFGADLDTAQVYNGFDLLVSTSRTEGFSNVIGEAMACGLPCVVTDVGDSAYIVGDFGEVLTSGTPPELAASMERCLQRREGKKNAIRAQIVERFSVDTLVRNTEARLQKLVDRC